MTYYNDAEESVYDHGKRDGAAHVMAMIDARREYWQNAVDAPGSCIDEDKVQALMYELGRMRVEIGRAFKFPDPEWW